MAFATFGTSHLVVLGVFVVALAPLVSSGRRVRGTPREQPYRRALAVSMVVVMVPLQLIDLLPGRFRLDTSLPLQLCDVAWVTAAIALWTGRRLPGVLVQYWGLTLTTQALITPWLHEDFPDPKFWLFWFMHLAIVWTAVLLTWGLGVRPDWRDYRRAVAATVTWMAAVFAINLALDTNYGFVNAKPAGSVLDLLGPWPAYLGVEIAVVAAVWALMTLAWQRSQPRSQPRSQRRSARRHADDADDLDRAPARPGGRAWTISGRMAG